MTDTIFPKLTLTPSAAARVGRGHRWVYSNDMKSVDPGAEESGTVAVVNEAGAFLGSAVYNKHALIRARIFSTDRVRFDAAFLKEKLKTAVERRRRLLPGREACRLVFSEADSLPGLIVDQYGSALSIQIHSQAVEALREPLLDALDKLLEPIAIVEKSDAQTREYESIPGREPIMVGKLPEEHVVTINELLFGVNLAQGQKTGLYLDQAENWPLVVPYAEGKKVLDLFSNVGGFSLHAAAAGAESVKAIDSSDLALSQLLFNAERNGLAGKIRTKKSDAFLYVRSQPESFGLIICDPPAFAKSKKQADSALRGYRELNRQCLKMLEPNGILISCSCSAAVDFEDFEKMLTIASKDAGRPVRVLGRYGLPVDHAPLIAMPETHYLKVFIVEAVG